MGETSPLLISSSGSGAQLPEASPDNHPHHHHRGSASVMETIVNEANTCMGTGCLVLPFAAKLGGVILHVTGIVGIALWNIYSVHRLCQCLQLLPRGAVLFEEADEIPSSLAKQTARSESAISSQEGHDNPSLELPSSHTHTIPPFHHRLSPGDPLPRYASTGLSNPHQQSTPTTKVHPPPPRGTSTYSRVAWYAYGPGGLLALDLMMMTLFIGVVVAFVNAIRGFLRDTPFTTNSDILDAVAIGLVIGPMSTVKDMGYLAKASATGILALFLSFAVIALYGLVGYHSNSGEGDGSVANRSVNWFPENGLNGVSTWFGSTVFGYGVAPLTYNFLESMAQPQRMVPASAVALMIVAIVYVVLGVGLYSLFREVDGDILHVLPSAGCLPMLTRLSMVVVVAVTAPLLIVPCGQLVEGKLLRSSAVTNEVPFYIRATVRIGIALMCVSISVLVPGFVSVLSLVGCASVATVGFVVPPALFLRLRLMRAQWSWDLAFDVAMLFWGIIATGITTSYTIQDVMSSKV